MKKLVVIGLAMAMTAAMVNGVCAQPVQAADGEGLKVALLLSGAANDQGWNQTAYEGAQKACEKYGYELAYTENLEVADISAAFADYASAGYDVVIGHGYEFGDPALEVAETYPDTKFICTEADASADNVASYVMACEQTNFCRRCNYCAPCTVGISIPSAFLFAGYLERYNLADWAKDRYGSMAVKASACVGCGKCETRCPYHLPIREMLKKVAEEFGE